LSGEAFVTEFRIRAGPMSVENSPFMFLYGYRIDGKFFQLQD